MFKHVLLPTDGSELSRKATTAAIDFAKSSGATITAFTFMDEYPFLQSSDASHQTRRAFEEHAAAEARARLNQIVAEAKAESVTCGTDMTTSSTPYKDIVEAAIRHGCDVIFMASHGRRGLAGLLVGSETQKVLTHCTIPVLVYR
ncbi:Universal stress protein family (plasmid) [Cupriavidus necator H850]|uniref:universal stress protein n=1 Tax=Cupriavidus necator TaxID=106590 RepID=UPI00129D8E8B|nr:universal stress protein [Cupriavidus necator]KAI3604932.1 Universal stress protein family [Cupriavidus necator H850]